MSPESTSVAPWDQHSAEVEFAVIKMPPKATSIILSLPHNMEVELGGMFTSTLP